MSHNVKVLGIQFFNGPPRAAIESLCQQGGFAIAPSGTCFARLERDLAYREAVTRSDLALADSGAMVLLWKIFRFRKIERISGLRYLKELVRYLGASDRSRILWIVPNEVARGKIDAWLTLHHFQSASRDIYVAPFYGQAVQDQALLDRLTQSKPEHVIIGIGSGPQEKLGAYLRDRLPYQPAIHCIGAALGFLTGDQVKIPDWADRFYLGWLFRLFAQPRIFLPRLVRAIRLPWLIIRYGSELPPLRSGG